MNYWNRRSRLSGLGRRRRRESLTGRANPLSVRGVVSYKQEVPE
jgi:hypothetical protein